MSLLAFKQETYSNGWMALGMAVAFPATSHEDIIHDQDKPYIPSYSHISTLQTLGIISPKQQER